MHPSDRAQVANNRPRSLRRPSPIVLGRDEARPRAELWWLIVGRLVFPLVASSQLPLASCSANGQLEVDSKSAAWDLWRSAIHCCWLAALLRNKQRPVGPQLLSLVACCCCCCMGALTMCSFVVPARA